MRRRAALGADLLVLTELFLCGYPPEDLVLKPALQEACRDAAEDLGDVTREGPGIVVGCPWVDEGQLHNSALLLEKGKIAAIRHKVELPNYGVFDELRVFKPGPHPGPVDFRGVQDRHADLRGHLAPRRHAKRWRRPARRS